MTNGAGKGSSPRPVNRKKYEENYEKIFNKTSGIIPCEFCDDGCPRCNWMGFFNVEKKKKEYK